MIKKNIKDIVLISSILFISLLSLLVLKLTSKNDNLTALVYYNNEIILTINLSDLNDEIVEYSVTGDIGELVISAKHNAIAITEENCPYQLCMKQGYITNTNQSLICLPNKVYIKIISNSNSGVDVEL